MFTHAFSRMAARRVAAAATTTTCRGKATIPQGQRYSNVHSSFKQTWLMDAGAYPVMAILAFAVTMCTSFTLFKGATHPDNRLSPAKRNAVIRTWE